MGEALDAVLKSVNNQQILPDEIIIADDGSGDETLKIIEHWKTIIPVPLHHVWHNDDGFRLSEIRNKAIKKAKNNYIIQVDGDTILHANFIKDHISFAKKGVFISGSRVLLHSKTTNKILEKKQFPFFILFHGVKNRLNGIYFPLINRFLSAKNEPKEKLIFKVRGCNMSFWRDDLITINGYNEDIKGWGIEDSEISLRLLNLGLSLKRIKMAGIQYHLHHKEASKNSVNHKTSILKQSIKENILYAKNVIIK